MSSCWRILRPQQAIFRNGQRASKGLRNGPKGLFSAEMRENRLTVQVQISGPGPEWPNPDNPETRHPESNLFRRAEVQATSRKSWDRHACAVRRWGVEVTSSQAHCFCLVSFAPYTLYWYRPYSIDGPLKQGSTPNARTR